ncbi:MAG: WxcM-like domain-containing protein [Bacteroidales bacterium]|nr:WxcM-like domain-containing protein [Bacteroidales bacterium]
MANVDDCKLISLPKEEFDEGHLTYVYDNVHIPFAVRRVFYTYDIPSGESRGAHAHRHCHQLLVAVSGAFEVVLDDGVRRRTVMLNRPNIGLHIPPGIWASEQEFSSCSVCLVLASHRYEESDYIRSYADFLEYLKNG